MLAEAQDSPRTDSSTSPSAWARIRQTLESLPLDAVVERVAEATQHASTSIESQTVDGAATPPRKPELSALAAQEKIAREQFEKIREEEWKARQLELEEERLANEEAVLQARLR